MGIDSWLPDFDVGMRHETVLGLAPERAMALALATPAGSDASVRLLLRARGLRADDSLEEFLSPRNGFVVLERTPTEFVGGMAAAVWRPRGGSARLEDPAGWTTWAEPGTVRVAFCLRAQALPSGGSSLVTETRVRAVDKPALRAFRRYWRLVGPFSALIRRRWLRAIERRA